MEVRCSNCSTEYEFDDALVSARGTSVKCTNCGHQFRVHAPTPATGGAETWVVRDARGRETMFTSLRELQQAIVRGGIDQKHEMSHAGGPYRPLQDIYELQSFFDAARKRATQQRQPPRTLLGVGYDALALAQAARPAGSREAGASEAGSPAGSPGVGSPSNTAVSPSMPPARRSAPPPRNAVGPTRTSVPPPRRRPHDTAGLQDRVTPVAGVPAMQSIPYPKVDPPHGPGDTHTLAESGARPAPRMSSPGPLGVIERHSLPPDRPSSPGERFSTPFDLPAKPFAAPAAADPVVPWQNLQGLRDDPELDPHAQRRGTGLRWILAVVVVGGLALVGATVGRDYLTRYIRREPEKPLVDQRVPALLEQARGAFARGDFDNTNSALSKASVLAETDPGVAMGLAKLEVARAEPLWLMQRINTLLDAAAAERDKDKDKAAARHRKPTDAETPADAEAAQKRALERKQLELSFHERMTRIKPAVASANFRAATAPDTIRARVDALRLEGQLKEARGLLAPVSSSGSDPDTAFTLGALDLAEGESGTASAIDRLRSAARTEEGLGRARALLIFALTQAGDTAAASAELDKLSTLAPQHPALGSLRSLLELAQNKQAPPPEEPRRPVASARPAPTTVPAAAPASAPSAANSGGEDLQSLLSQAGALHRQGELDGAERIYQGILSRSPKNIPALSGLADIARQRRAVTTAAALYDQILKIDRNHVPTLMSRADLYWAAGNRILAVALYRRALMQVGSSDPLGQHALQRIEQYDKEGAAPDTSGASPSEGSSPAPAAHPVPAPAPAQDTPLVPAPNTSPGSGSGASPSPPSTPAPAPAPSTDGSPTPRPNPRFPPPPIPAPPRESAPAPSPSPSRVPAAPDGTGSAPPNP